jgi:hypothetical protein
MRPKKKPFTFQFFNPLIYFENPNYEIYLNVLPVLHHDDIGMVDNNNL